MIYLGGSMKIDKKSNKYIYVIVGINIKRIRKEKGLKKSVNVKLYLSQEEIIKVEKMETKFELLIEMGKTFHDIKDMYIK